MIWMKNNLMLNTSLMAQLGYKENGMSDVSSYVCHLPAGMVISLQQNTCTFFQGKSHLLLSLLSVQLQF